MGYLQGTFSIFSDEGYLQKATCGILRYFRDTVKFDRQSYSSGTNFFVANLGAMRETKLYTKT